MTLTLADVIDLAINEYLWDGRVPRLDPLFTCVAVEKACSSDARSYYRAQTFMLDLGCDVGSTLMFNEFERSDERQYARALWLTWAAMIAREEGL